MYQDTTLALSTVREPESEEKPQKSLNEKQQVRKASHCNLDEAEKTGSFMQT